MLVAGEAASLVTRNWGEGIYSALVSGELAAGYCNNPEAYRRGVERSLIPFLAERLKRAKKIYNIGLEEGASPDNAVVAGFSPFSRPMSREGDVFRVPWL